MSRLLTSLESFVRPSQSRYVGPSKLRRNVSATDNTRSRLHHRLGRNAKFCCKQRHYTSRAACLAAPELEKLAEVQVTQASTGLVVDAASLLDSGKVLLLPFMTHFGDFDSWEFALKLVDRMPELEEAGVEVVAFGIGSLAGARKFAVSTGFPMARLYADGRGAAANALGFSPGVGRKGGYLPFLEGIPGEVKLLLMCAGVGSPGTLREVIRGYRGDKSAPQVFNTGSAVDLRWKVLFNVLGEGYQRPFELATLRLRNMLSILGSWKVLAPADKDLLVQRGGVLLLKDLGEGLEVVWRYDDPGILGYADIDSVVSRALAATDGIHSSDAQRS